MLAQTNATSRTVVTLLVVAALFAAGHALRHTASCFLLSLAIAYLLDPCVVLLERRKLSRVNAIICIYVLIFLFLCFFFSFMVPFLTLRWEALVPSIPLYLQKAKALGLELQGKFYGGSDWAWVYDKVVEHVNQLFSKMGAGMYSAAASVVFNLFNLVLSPILVFFMLYYKSETKELLAGWLPVRHRQALLQLGCQIDDSIGGYLKGQLVVSVIVAVLASIALLILEVDYPIFNGIFAGLASTLPFIGVILATIPPLFFAYLKFQSGFALVKVLVSFGVIYFLEGYLVKPLVFKSSMDLNPLLTIIMVMALGELFGFWGIILAIPVAAALKLLSVSIKRGDYRSEDAA